MKIKKMLKFSFAAMLLAVSTSAYAQAEPTEPAAVNLKNGTAVTWSDFADAINNGVQGSVNQETQNAWTTAQTNLTNAQTEADNAAKAVSDAKTAYDNTVNTLSTKQAELQVLNASTDKAPVEWLKTAYDAANAFSTAFQKVLNSDTYNENNIYIYILLDTSRRAAKLTISYTEQSGYTKVGETEFYNTMNEATEKPSSLFINLGKNASGEYNYTDGTDGLLLVGSYSSNFKTIATNALNALQTLVNDGKYDTKAAQKQALSEEITNLTSTKNTQYETYTNAQTTQAQKDEALQTAQENYDTAKTAYDEAVANANADALANYKEVTLTGDVTANATINKYDGNINGNGHVITLGGSVSSLFNSFTGSIINTAVNGTFAMATGGASFGTVANWVNNTGRFYDDMGTITNFNTLGALGFAARNSFGVNFAGNTLSALTEESMVYSITIYEPNSTTQHYVVAKDGKLYDSNSVEVVIPTNMFAKSETTDLTGIANIFFDDNTCANVVIEDRVQFYCPVDLVAENLTFNRTFKSGYNVVCVPFELNGDLNTAITSVCTYDKETAEKFWFKKVAESIPANTPALLVANAEFKFENLSNVTIKKTDSQIIMDEGDANDPSKCYGILKSATREEFKGGASEAYKIYGLKGGEFVSAGEGSTYPAFRSVIYSEIAQSSKMAAPRRIGIIDAKGIDITDELMSGIENVTTGDSSLNVAAGQGEIIITSNADFGKVAIYSLDGKTVAVADVIAGTTTVNVQSGIYVVMGKKVMIK